MNDRDSAQILSELKEMRAILREQKSTLHALLRHETRRAEADAKATEELERHAFKWPPTPAEAS